LETHLNKKREHFREKKKKAVKNILHPGMQIKFDIEFKADSVRNFIL
jgi:hypothetical protein